MSYGMDPKRNSPLSKDVYSGSGGASIKTLSASLCKTRVLASTRARFVLVVALVIRSIGWYLRSLGLAKIRERMQMPCIRYTPYSLGKHAQY